MSSVGSTRGFGPEVGSNFTSGGFSNVFGRASWQADVVGAYLEILDSNSKYESIKGKFNRTGRGYPMFR